MKKKMAILFLAASPLFAFAATDSCSNQLSALNAKIEQAKKYDNRAELSRLNIARDKVKTYCTEDRQAQRANQDVGKQQRNVKKAELELQEAQHELEEAKADGRLDKISKKTHKVEEKKLKVESAKRELSQAQADAARLN
ncbi:MAG: DUF1090 family protein [Pantoea sp.]|uniref:DUF1090 family protein n=1 Tax=Pantoea septica TaxID=472695 RepID=UPI001C0FD9D0|nr:DUF1090 family protein [Pantoea septica]MBU5379549.1 DUF1090 domain-containing protein [Pantoea septica]MDU6438647.1 DUF1090 family protein [Pantoea sp.]